MLVTIARFSMPLEAGIARARLEAGGISVLLAAGALMSLIFMSIR